MHHASRKAHASCCQRTAPHPRRLAASHGLGAAAYTDALISLHAASLVPCTTTSAFSNTPWKEWHTFQSVQREARLAC